MSEEKEVVQPNPENPESVTWLQQTDPGKSAAGWSSIGSTIRHITGEMNPLRGAYALLRMNQHHGFDCPGCAWPDPDDRSSIGEFCENGAKAVAEEATFRRVTPDFFHEHTVENLATLDDYKIGKHGRITEPVVLRPGSKNYQPISWKLAYKLIADKLNSLDSPDQAAFYTSGRTSNEAAFLYQLMVRLYGTNNLPDCSNMCHESSEIALSETLGIGKGTVTLDDFEKTELIIVAGQNPGTSHPRMLSALEKAKKSGAKIIAINPLQEAGLVRFQNPQKISGLFGKGTPLADLFLQVRPGGDIALIKSIMRQLLEDEKRQRGICFDGNFIKEQTTGYEAFSTALNNEKFEDLVSKSGVPMQDIQQAIAIIRKTKKIIICWAMGLTQHTNGVNIIREYVNLLLLKGSIGKPGAGTCPVRGHSNVQGDRTMGITDKPKKEFLDNLQKQYSFTPPREEGLNTVNTIKAMHKGAVKVFFAMGGNFLSATPDTLYTAEAIRKTDLTVQISTKLNRSHLVTGKTALILPCLGRTENDKQESGAQFVSVENSSGVVHMSKGDLKPASTHLKSEPAIICELAEVLFRNKYKIRWTDFKDDYDNIRDDIEKVIPGFSLYNARVREDGGFYLPNGAREGKYNTISGKAVFTINPTLKLELADDQYQMMTIRSHDQFNTTIYGRDDRYRGLYGERRVVLMNPDDMVRAGLKNHEPVNLINNHNSITRTARNFLVVPYDIPPKCIATYFPEANVLVPIDSYGDRSYTPSSKLVVVTMTKNNSAGDFPG